MIGLLGLFALWAAGSDGGGFLFCFLGWLICFTGCLHWYGSLCCCGLSSLWVWLYGPLGYSVSRIWCLWVVWCFIWFAGVTLVWTYSGEVGGFGFLVSSFSFGFCLR